jgi:hypothetical protein
LSVLAAHLGGTAAPAKRVSGPEVSWVSQGEINVGERWWFLTASYVERLARLAGFRMRRSVPDVRDPVLHLLLDVA